MSSLLSSSILIVDAQPTSLEGISKALNRVGLDVAIATNGELALQQIARKRPELILLDAKLPGIDGFETCQRLKANPATSDIPILLMIDLADRKSQVKALESGAADYVTKPFQIQEVLTRVRTHLQLQVEQIRVAELAKANEVLQQTASQLADSQDLNDFLNHLLLEAAQEMGAVNNSIFLCDDPPSQTYRMHHSVHDGQVIDLNTDPRFEFWKNTVISTENKNWRLIQSQGYIWYVLEPDETETDLCNFSIIWHRDMQHRAVICVLLQLGNEPLGYMGLYFREPVQPSPERVRLLQTLANQAALAIQLTRLSKKAKQTAIACEREQAAQAQATELSRANRLLRNSLSRLSTNPNLNDILGHLLVELVAYAGAAVGHIFIYDPKQNTMNFKARCRDGQAFWTPAEDEPVLFQVPMPLEQTPIFEQLSNQPQLAVLNQPEFEGRMWPGVLEWFQAKGYQGTSSCILMVGDRPLGMLAMAFPQPIAFRSVEEELILALVQQIALVVQLTQFSEVEKQQAIAREREQAAQNQIAELVRANHVMRECVDRISQATNLDQLRPNLLGVLMTLLGAIGCSLWRYNASDGSVTLDQEFAEGQFYTRATSGFAHPEKHFFTPDHAPSFEKHQRLIAGEIQILDVKTSNVFLLNEREHLLAQGVSTLIVLPMTAAGQHLGRLALNFQEVRLLSPSEYEMAQFITNQLALALQMADLAEDVKQAAIAREREQAAQERAAELIKANVVLRGTMARLASESSLEEFLEHVLAQACRNAKDSGAILIYDEHQDHLVVTATYGSKIPYYTDQPIIPTAHFPDWLTLITAKRPIILEPDSSEFYIEEVADWHQQQGHQRIIATPLIVDNLPLGVFGVALCDEPPPNKVELELFQALAQQVTLAIQLTKLAEEAKQAAIAREREQAAQQRVIELANTNDALQRSVAYLTTADSLQLFLNSVLQEVFQTSTDIDSTVVFGYSPLSHTLQLLAMVIQGEVIDIATDPQAEVYRSPIPSEVAGDWHISNPERQIVWVNVDNLLFEQAIPWHKQRGHQRLNAIPLFGGGQPLGFVGMSFTTCNPPTEAQIEQWWVFAQHISLALRLANLAEEAKQTAILDERNRMARDIHDTLAQSFTGIIMQLEALKGILVMDSDEIQTRLDRISNMARLGLSEARRSVQALRPQALETANLVDALRQLLQQMTQGAPVQTKFYVEGAVQPLTATIEENLHHIAQEALTNAIRHGHPQSILVRLLFEPATVYLQIIDDGCGFTPTEETISGFGLIGMQERVHRLGGQLYLTSQPEQGTKIIVTVPLRK